MANIVGTNDSDYLVGTIYADRIVPLLGHDRVDGGAGRDTLVVDYRVSSASYDAYSYIYSIEGSLGGNIDSGDYLSSVGFDGVEHLQLKLGNGSSTVDIDGSALAHGATLDIDAGSGSDHLQANLSALEAIEFQVGSNGKAKVGSSTFANFESFFLILGAGADKVRLSAGDDIVLSGGGNDNLDGGAGNDMLAGGDGDDVIGGGKGDDALYGEGGRNVLLGGDGDDGLESRGVDQVDGGAGNDLWQGIYWAATENLTFSYDGSVGTVSNGTTVVNVENIVFEGGSGDDTVSISGVVPNSDQFISVGTQGGNDTLNLDLSNGVANTDYIFMYPEDGALSGNAASVSFDGVEQLTVTGDVGDTANLSFFDFGTSIDIVVQPDGTLTSNVGITLSNYAAFDLQLDDGNDAASLGAASDRVNGMGGDDVIAGGGGGDDLSGGSGADTFVYNAIEDFGDEAVRIDGIWDFSSEEGDKIDLRNVTPGEFAFVEDQEFSGQGAAELRAVDAGDGYSFVSGDIDGNGSADFYLVVLSTAPLTSADFMF
jgi:Ca2+-binding RTX toxin-like protein